MSSSTNLLTITDLGDDSPFWIWNLQRSKNLIASHSICITKPNGQKTDTVYVIQKINSPWGKILQVLPSYHTHSHRYHTQVFCFPSNGFNSYRGQGTSPDVNFRTPVMANTNSALRHAEDTQWNCHWFAHIGLGIWSGSTGRQKSILK